MAIDFSSLQATPAQSGQIDFSAIGGIPAVGQDSKEDETTALGAAGRGAAGMIPMGTQALAAAASLAEKKPYLQERQEIEKEIEADKANHPIPRIAGQAAGVMAPALLTGGSTAPESLAGAAGQGAIVGGGFGAGNAIDTLASGGSGTKAAGDVAIGAGLGALGGAAGQKIAGALKETIPAIQTFAAKKAAQSIGMGSEELGNMSPQELIDTGNMLMDKGIVKPGAPTQEMFDTAKALHEQYGDKIREIGNQAKQLGLSTDIKPLLTRLEEKYQAASALQNPDEMRNALFYKKGMADILTMARQNLPETLADVQGAPVPSDITFDQLQRLKKSYGNSAFMNGTVKNPAAADVYSALSAGQKAIVNTARENPNLPNELKDAMAGYSKLYPVVDGLQDVLGRERAGNMPAKGFGMMGKMVGQLPGQTNPVINALTALGLLGAGHPMWALGAFTATLQNSRTMANAATAVANTIPGIAEKLPQMSSQIVGFAVSNPQKTGPVIPDTNHPAMAPWQQMFQKNAANATDTSEIEKSHAVTDFILSQRDPAYATAKQKMADEQQSSPISQSGKLGMAEGGVVPHTDDKSKITEPLPELGSTLEGFHNLLTKKEPENAPVPLAIEKVSYKQQNKQPFNSAMEEQLKTFLEGKKDENR